jgi:hypothetical protein
VLIELLVSKDTTKNLALLPGTRAAPQDGSATAASETAVAHSSSRAEASVPLESIAGYVLPSLVGGAPAAIPAPRP